MNLTKHPKLQKKNLFFGVGGGGGLVGGGGAGVSEFFHYEYYESKF